MKNKKAIIKKYEFTGEVRSYGCTRLRKIRALRAFGNVKKGELGGFIRSQTNLSHRGNCWVAGEAEVCGEARVSGNALVKDHAQVNCEAKIMGRACITDWAEVSGAATVRGSAMLRGNAKVRQDAEVYGEAVVGWDSVVEGNARIGGTLVLSNGELSTLAWKRVMTPRRKRDCLSYS